EAAQTERRTAGARLGTRHPAHLGQPRDLGRETREKPAEGAEDRLRGDVPAARGDEGAAHVAEEIAVARPAVLRQGEARAAGHGQAERARLPVLARVGVDLQAVDGGQVELDRKSTR